MTIEPLSPEMAYVYTVLGAIFLWGRWGRKRLKVYVLADLIELLPAPDSLKHVLEFFIFILLGGFIGVALTNPVTAPQAIAAGLGWTSMLAKR